jgi:hypothetical protein
MSSFKVFGIDKLNNQVKFKDCDSPNLYDIVGELIKDNSIKSVVIQCLWKQWRC